MQFVRDFGFPLTFSNPTNVNFSGCLPKFLMTQIGHKIYFLQILYMNYTSSGYFKNTFRLGSKCFLLQFKRGVPWWTKTDILLKIRVGAHGEKKQIFALNLDLQAHNHCEDHGFGSFGISSR